MSSAAVAATATDHLRVLFVDDDEFARAIIGEALSRSMSVQCAGSVAEAITRIAEFDPHAVVTDLNFGTGPDGGDLVRYVAEHCPWVGCVVLSAHSSEYLAIGREMPDLPGLTYLVKGDLNTVDSLTKAIVTAIDGSQRSPGKANAQGARMPVRPLSDRRVVTKSQAEALRMIADGLSNAAIARTLGITMRSAESLVQRTIQGLGLRSDGDVNVRVLAARLWAEGKVDVR